MSADALDFTPHDYESLTPADVKRCFIVSDVADRILADAIDAVASVMDQMPHEARPAIAIAYMQVSALVYLAERLASGAAPGQPQTADK